MNRVSGKVALVTGVASNPGLGYAIARKLAAEGAKVVATDLDLPGAEKCAAAIREAGGEADAVKLDVTDDGDWDRAFATVTERHSRLDILVNNAGVLVPGTVDGLETASFVRQIDVNLTSVFRGTKRAMQSMRATGQGGSIVNIASIGGNVGVPGGSAYCASKGGVRLFTKAAALECARDGIRVNSVHPGMIMTNMAQWGIEQVGATEAIVASIPMGRIGDPDDIANCVLFLASEESGYITGAEFIVDGGSSAQ